MALARPNKIFDVASLESWLTATHPSIIDTWEYSEAVEWIDLWDWLDQEFSDILDEFEYWWKAAQLQEQRCRGKKRE